MHRRCLLSAGLRLDRACRCFRFGDKLPRKRILRSTAEDLNIFLTQNAWSVATYDDKASKFGERIFTCGSGCTIHKACEMQSRPYLVIATVSDFFLMHGGCGVCGAAGGRATYRRPGAAGMTLDPIPLFAVLLMLLFYDPFVPFSFVPSLSISFRG